MCLLANNPDLSQTLLMLRLACSSLGKFLTRPAFATFCNSNQWTPEHSKAAQEAMYCQRVIDCIVNAPIPDPKTPLDQWETLSDKCKKVNIDLLDGMEPISQARHKIMDMITVTQGTRLQAYYQQQDRVQDGILDGKVVFFLTYSVTQAMFKKLVDNGPSFISSGNFGISKTFALIFWCQLTKIISDYMVKYGKSTLGKQVVTRYKLQTYPMTFYFSLEKGNALEDAFNSIAKQTNQQFRSSVSNLKDTPKIFSELRRRYKDDHDINVRFVFDQINAYFSWVQKVKDFKPGQESQQQLRKKIKVWTPFLRDLADSWMWMTYNSSVNLQLDLQRFCSGKQEYFWFDHNSHKIVHRKQILLGETQPKRINFSKEMSNILLFVLELKGRSIKGIDVSKLPKRLQELRHILRDQEWPLYTNFLTIMEVVKNKEGLEDILGDNDKGEQILKDLVTSIERKCIDAMVVKADKFKKERRSVVLDMYQATISYLKQAKLDNNAQLPIKIPLDWIDKRVRQDQNVQDAEDFIENEFPYLINKHFFKLNQLSSGKKELLVFISLSDVNKVLKRFSQRAQQEINAQEKPQKLSKYKVESGIRDSIEKKIIKKMQWRYDVALNDILCDQITTFPHIDQFLKVKSFQKHFQKALQTVNQKGHVLAFPNASDEVQSQTSALFDAVYMTKTQNKITIYPIDFTATNKKSDVLSKVNNMYTLWAKYMMKSKELIEMGARIRPVILCLKKHVRDVIVYSDFAHKQLYQVDFSELKIDQAVAAPIDNLCLELNQSRSQQRKNLYLEKVISQINKLDPAQTKSNKLKKKVII